jgi:hypothetical protein
MSTGYRIADEPAPSRLSHVAVNPIWPLFAVMFGGSWLSWPWFAVNAFAMGSPTRVKEAIGVVVGFAGNIAFTIGLVLLLGLQWIPQWTAPYLFIAFSGWKLAVSYALFTSQARTFGLFEYYGGKAQSGAIIVFLGFMARRAMSLPPLALLVFG